jgi:hypothetical protein
VNRISTVTPRGWSAKLWSALRLQDDSSEEMTEAREPQIGERSWTVEAPLMP